MNCQNLQNVSIFHEKKWFWAVLAKKFLEESLIHQENLLYFGLTFKDPSS